MIYKSLSEMNIEEKEYLRSILRYNAKLRDYANTIKKFSFNNMIYSTIKL